jgi:ribosomal RNA-processing protein 9
VGERALFISISHSTSIFIRSICLWTMLKKKPVFTEQLAHGLHESISETEGTIYTPRWITSVATLRYSDFFVSGNVYHITSMLVLDQSIAPGSWDGTIRLWKLDPKLKSFTFLSTLSAPGFVNSLQVLAPPSIEATWLHASHSNSPSQLNGDGPHHLSLPNGEDIPQGSTNHHSKHALVIAGLGQEPRLGRWMRIAGEGTGSRNQTVVVAIPFNE